MLSREETLSTSERPDLEEFLSVLNGFLDKPIAKIETPYLRFLEVFCRSVGASEGHFLRGLQEGELRSLVSFGLGGDFNENFNRSRCNNPPAPSPVDSAFQKKEVVAIVDLHKDSATPGWFMDIMNRKNIASLVAVPLLSGDRSLGVMCAYFRDVCLFDQGTLHHLTMIGRMLGGAIDRLLGRGFPDPRALMERSEDNFLELLVSRPVSKYQVFNALSKFSLNALHFDAVVCGPLRRTHLGLIMTVAAGANTSSLALSHRFVVPPFLEERLMKGYPRMDIKKAPREAWGSLKNFIRSPSPMPLCRPLMWQKKLLGAVVGWREKGPGFLPGDILLLSRLVNIASLSLHTVP